MARISVHYFIYTFHEGYVQEIYESFLDCQKNNHLEKELKELEKMTPQFMNTMMDKQLKEEAIKKNIKRKVMVVEDVPPTTAGTKKLNLSNTD